LFIFILACAGQHRVEAALEKKSIEADWWRKRFYLQASDVSLCVGERGRALGYFFFLSFSETSVRCELGKTWISFRGSEFPWKKQKWGDKATRPK
jgi:hypothetical protein